MARTNFNPLNDPSPDDSTHLQYKKGITETPFDEWLQENLPSRVRDEEDYGWVCVRNELNCKFGKHGVDLYGLITNSKLSGTVNHETLKDLALEYQVLTGKWILFTDHGGKVDHLWSLIAKFIMENEYPCCSAKVSAHLNSNRQVISIYNPDFTNTVEVLEAERAIRRMGIKGRLQYKPDIYTYMFTFGRNRWGIKPYIMTSEFDLKTWSSIVKTVV